MDSSDNDFFMSKYYGNDKVTGDTVCRKGLGGSGKMDCGSG